MADIFISYGREDQETARMLAQALAGQRWSVWWDQSIPPGKTWADVVGKQLTAARCVLALWSKTSVTKRWVLKEARFADKRGTLIPVLIEDVEPPFEFGDIQAANLKNWQGDVSHAGYTHLLESVSEVLSTPLPATTGEQNVIGTKHFAVEGPTVPHFHSPEPIDGGQLTLDEPGSARAQNELSKDNAQSIKGPRTWFATLVKPSKSPIIMFMLGITFLTLGLLLLGMAGPLINELQREGNPVRQSINIPLAVVIVYAIYLIFYSLFGGIRKLWLAHRLRNKGAWFALCVYFLGGTIALAIITAVIGKPEFMMIGVGGWAFICLFLLFWNAKNLAHGSGKWIARLLIVIIILAWIGAGTH